MKRLGRHLSAGSRGCDAFMTCERYFVTRKEIYRISPPVASYYWWLRIEHHRSSRNRRDRTPTQYDRGVQPGTAKTRENPKHACRNPTHLPSAPRLTRCSSS